MDRMWGQQKLCVRVCVVDDKVNVQDKHTRMHDPEGECVFEQDTPGGPGSHLVTHTQTLPPLYLFLEMITTPTHTHVKTLTHSLPSTRNSLVNEKTHLCMFLLSDERKH